MVRGRMCYGATHAGSQTVGTVRGASRPLPKWNWQPPVTARRTKLGTVQDRGTRCGYGRAAGESRGGRGLGFRGASPKNARARGGWSGEGYRVR